MSPPTKLLLGSVVVFFAIAGSGIDFERVVEERPVITFLLRAVVILCLAGAAVSVIWWPFSFRARRKRAKARRLAALESEDEPHVRADAGGGGSVAPSWPTA